MNRYRCIFIFIFALLVTECISSTSGIPETSENTTESGIIPKTPSSWKIGEGCFDQCPEDLTRPGSPESYNRQSRPEEDFLTYNPSKFLVYQVKMHARPVTVAIAKEMGVSQSKGEIFASHIFKM